MQPLVNDTIKKKKKQAPKAALKEENHNLKYLENQSDYRFKRQLRENNSLRLPKFRFTMYPISSLSLVTNHQFTNNMFTLYPYIKRENPRFNSIQQKGNQEKQKYSMQISHFFKWKNSQLDQKFVLLICFSLKQFLIKYKHMHKGSEPNIGLTSPCFPEGLKSNSISSNHPF